MFGSIRTKLAVSYALIIFFCLLLAGSGALILIRRYQRDAVLNQRRAVAATLSQRAQGLLASQLGLPQMALRLSQEAQRLRVRALLVARDGVILLDTAEDAPFTGHRIQFPIDELLGPRESAVVRRRLDADGQSYFFIILPLRPAAAEARSESGVSPSYVIVIEREQDVEPAWRQLARPLATAGFLALFASTIVAVVLAGSITRPLLAMTKASEEMARGNYQHVIPTEGQDEVARLAHSFGRMADEVERSRQSQRDFLASISHDLKTPLTSIQGFAQAMLEGAIHDEEGYRRAAQIIREEAEGMGQLIQKLLVLARFDAGELIHERVAIAPGELVKHCLGKFMPMAAEVGVELSVLIPKSLPVIYGDQGYLEQALSNLVDNGIRYTPPGGRIDVAVQVVDLKAGKIQGRGDMPCGIPSHKRLDGRWVAISVKDTGSGISKQDLPRIFERFYRADRSRSGAKGSGLGLAIAKETVEAHGGVIGVSSQPNRGSCFSIVLPAG
jgi:signal transduction histidine kinase